MEQRLYRSRTDRILFGVAGGMGEYFNIDSTIIRIIFVILAIWGGVGFLIYLIAALLIPEEPERRETIEMVQEEKPKKGTKKEVIEETVIAEDVNGRDEEKVGKENRKGEWRGEKILGLIILGLGLIFLAEEFIPGFNFGQLWPLILIVIGLLILTGSFRRRS